MESWPFDDLEDVLTLTVRQIMDGGQPILRVCHDAGAGMWQFLNTAGPVPRANAVLVGLREVYAIDPSITQVSDLPLGWTAERSAPGQSWHRKPLG
jgi:hypothetical protein